MGSSPQYFYLSSAVDFNDPFDMQGKILDRMPIDKKKDVLRERIRNLYPDLSAYQRKLMIRDVSADPIAFNAHVKVMLKKTASNFGVACVSTIPCSIQMWSHYADNHRGIALQFNQAWHIQSFFHILPVEYSDVYPELDYFDRGDYEQYQILLLRKQPGWAYEKEWRFLMVDSAKKHLPFNPRVLTAVILGCRIAQDDEIGCGR
ncbi:DUF2971 domain-containing protein [Nitrosospira sp. Nsp1]|uniref:DUF2971 domain-containing protein n=1 Tax=Nitrosospira sp. Nsp1 TaxID=136547 RepID=UPI000886C2C7|nr:DUF2971 domain-containing protein [Nitrosospira sp. Nsp1]SCX45755.1 Protein of unknown function [Nitrosospira sp. Nsp1]